LQLQIILAPTITAADTALNRASPYNDLLRSIGSVYVFVSVKIKAFLIYIGLISDESNLPSGWSKPCAVLISAPTDAVRIFWLRFVSIPGICKLAPDIQRRGRLFTCIYSNNIAVCRQMKENYMPNAFSLILHVHYSIIINI
jgi:hypothetical protein